MRAADKRVKMTESFLAVKHFTVGILVIALFDTLTHLGGSLLGMSQVNDDEEKLVLAVIAAVASLAAANHLYCIFGVFKENTTIVLIADLIQLIVTVIAFKDYLSWLSRIISCVTVIIVAVFACMIRSKSRLASDTIV